jgi:hypothetical protein
MKTLTLIAILLPFTTLAQFVEGDKFIGGTLSLSNQRTGSPDGGASQKITYFSIQPKMAFLLNENFAVGGTIGYASSQQQENPGIGVSKTNSFSMGIILRRYFRITDNFLISLDANPYYQKNKTEDYIPSETESNTIGLSVRPVFSFFPSKKWALEAGIGDLSFMRTKNETLDYTSSYFNLSYGTFSFGMTYYLKRNGE